MDLHENHELQSPGKSSIELISGYKYFIEVHPSKVTASDNVAEVPVEKRNCITNSEPFASSFYKKYSGTSCKVENAILKVIERMRCLPWDAPLSNKSHFKACDTLTYLRDGWSINYINEGTTNCIESCDVATYAHSLKREPISPQEDCIWLNEQYRLQKVSPSFAIPSTLDTLITVKKNQPEDFGRYIQRTLTEDPCHTFMKNSIIIEMQPHRKPVPIVHMQKKTTFSSQVATFGKKVLILLSMKVKLIYFRWNTRSLYWN